MKNKIALLAVAAIAVAGNVTTASAAGLPGFYISAKGGYIVPNMKGDFTDSFYGESKKENFLDSGLAISAAFGFQKHDWTKYLGFRAELEYKNAPKLDTDLQRIWYGAIVGKRQSYEYYSESRSNMLHSIMGNFFFDFTGLSQNFTPYIGLGAGYTMLKMDTEFKTEIYDAVGGTFAETNTSESQNYGAFGFKGSVGVLAKLTKNIDLDLGIYYEAASFDIKNSTKKESVSMSAFSAMAGLKFVF